MTSSISDSKGVEEFLYLAERPIPFSAQSLELDPTDDIDNQTNYYYTKNYYNVLKVH